VTEVNQDAPVLGLFADGNMPVPWQGDEAEQQGNLDDHIQCADNPDRTADMPALGQLTAHAIDLLSTKEDGFFLQVEGHAIATENHEANVCGQIGETVDLEEAVQQALEFAEEDGETLVLVTADHAHTSQIVGNVGQDEITELAEEED